MKLSKKTAHRAIISLCMFAPIAYLFGAMFFGLAGANGVEVFADTQQVTSEFQRVYYDTETIFDEGSVYRFVLDKDVLLNYYSNVGTSSTTLNFLTGTNSPSLDGLDFPAVNTNTLQLVAQRDTSSSGKQKMYMSYSIASSNTGITSGNNSVNVFAYSFSSGEGVWYNFNSYVYFKPVVGASNPTKVSSGFAGSSLYQVLYIEKETEVPAVVDYRDTIFGQMFPHDNFLERVGSNALSSSPVGFAPFATLIQYLDLNLFHGSDSQLALMVYGEVYWALNVVIADLVYHTMVWIPNLISKVFDWFDQKGVSDE